MIKTEEREIFQDVNVSFTCDVCSGEMIDDELEMQEAVSIRMSGGYSSIFGDGSGIALDLCQHCFRQLLGEYIKVEPAEF